MKKLTILISAVLIYGNVFAQNDAIKLREKNTYVDAHTLARLYDSLLSTLQSQYKDSIYTILTSYKWNLSNDSNFIFTHVLNLNSLLPIQHGTPHMPGAPTTSSPNILALNSSSASSEPSRGSLESQAINTLATFMATRAKEEVTYYAINRIFDFVNDNSTAAEKFKKIFPKTCDLVLKLKNGGVYYYSDFSMLKQTVQLDLNNLPYNFYYCIPEEQSNLKDGIYIATNVYGAITEGDKITELINEFGEEDSIWKTPQCLPFFHILQILSNAFIAPAGSRNIWLDQTQIADLDPANFNSNRTQQFFYGLLIQQFTFQPELVSLVNRLNNQNRTNNFIAHVYEFNQLSQNLLALYNSISKPATHDLAWYSQILQQSIKFLQETNNDSRDLLGTQIVSDNVFLYAENILEVIEDVQQKNYTGAAALVANYLLQNTDVSSDNFRKINFFIQLANVNDSSGFSNFLQSFTEPIGSSSIKRNSTFDVSLNGYVGINVGEELILSNPNGNKNNSGYVGVAAPIGVSVTFINGDITVFASVIDPGSLVNARFNNDSTNYSNLTFADFFSPGVGIYYNFKNAPITAGVYGCIINNLRNIQYTSGTSAAAVTETNKSVERISISVLVDIPFLTLSNSPRNK